MGFLSQLEQKIRTELHLTDNIDDKENVNALVNGLRHEMMEKFDNETLETIILCWENDYKDDELNGRPYKWTDADMNIYFTFNYQLTKTDKKLLEIGYKIADFQLGGSETEFLRYEYDCCSLKYFLSFFPRRNQVCIGLDVWRDGKKTKGNIAERLDPIVFILVAEKIVELGMNFDNTSWK